MMEVKFNKDVDRLICAGDIVDRGPQSVECLFLLNQPWFICAKGNHEQLMEEYFLHGDGEVWSWNGGQWAFKYVHGYDELSQKVISVVRDVVTELPFIITVEKKDGSLFHVLHAELPHQAGKVTDEQLANDDEFEKLLSYNRDSGEMSIIWSRHIFYQMFNQQLSDTMVRKIKRTAMLKKLNATFNENLSPIYSGHTIIQRPVRFFGQTNLDTCAYGSYMTHPSAWMGLTVTEPETDRFWLVNEREFKEVTPLVIQDLNAEQDTLFNTEFPSDEIK
jgi:hypothetical protein